MPEEVTYLPEVECVTSPGFLESQVNVEVKDETGQSQFLQVNKKIISRRGSTTYLPIGIVELDYRNKRALIELPHEADSGANRLWIPFSSFRRESEHR
jgi:hypothetical protein